MTIAEKNKEIRKKNKQRKLRRDITQVVLTGVITLILISAMIIKANAKGSEIIPNEYDVIEVYIKDNDRAWDIQEKLTPNESVSKMLHYAEIANGKQMGDIKPGEQIKFIIKK